MKARLDLFDLRRIVPEEPVHPAVDPELIPFSLERAAGSDLGFIGLIGPGPFFLNAGVELLPLDRRPSIS
jgi:hypothetical protein